MGPRMTSDAGTGLALWADFEVGLAGMRYPGVGLGLLTGVMVDAGASVGVGNGEGAPVGVAVGVGSTSEVCTSVGKGVGVASAPHAVIRTAAAMRGANIANGSTRLMVSPVPMLGHSLPRYQTLADIFRLRAISRRSRTFTHPSILKSPPRRSNGGSSVITAVVTTILLFVAGR